MPRRLEAGFAGRYLMPSVLMTSTMKSEPGMPLMRDNSLAGAASPAASCVGGIIAGAAGDELCKGRVALFAMRGPTAVAALASATEASNLRRLTARRTRRAGFLLVMKFLP